MHGKRRTVYGLDQSEVTIRAVRINPGHCFQRIVRSRRLDGINGGGQPLPKEQVAGAVQDQLVGDGVVLRVGVPREAVPDGNVADGDPVGGREGAKLGIAQDRRNRLSPALAMKMSRLPPLVSFRGPTLTGGLPTVNEAG